jgi:hypothetical protein
VFIENPIISHGNVDKSDNIDPPLFGGLNINSENYTIIG